MQSTASKNEINVEAPLTVIAGELRPWRRGRMLTPRAIAKFYPTEREHWLPGAMFEHRSPSRQLAYTLIVERHVPVTRVPAKRDLHTRGSWKYYQHTPARVMPEMVVVTIVSIEKVQP